MSAETSVHLAVVTIARCVDTIRNASAAPVWGCASSSRAVRHASKKMTTVTDDGGVGYFGQMNPEPLGLGKQPTDWGNSCLGSHSTTSGKSTVKAIVTKKTT